MSRRIAAPLLAACLACAGIGAVTGCGPDAAQGVHSARGTSGGPAPVSPSPSDFGFAGRHLLIGLQCSRDSAQVVGIDPDSGAIVARRTFTVPPVPDKDACGDEAMLPRQLFDRDYERMAVQIPDEENDADHVGYVDASGKVHDLTGAPGSGFADKQPHETTPVFDRVDNQIWFLGDDDLDGQKVYSRDVTTGAMTDRGTLPNRYGIFVYQGHRKATNFSLYGGVWLANPSGTAMVSGSVDPTGESIEIKALVGGKDTEPTVTLADAASGCGPAGWLDDHTALCREIDYSGAGRTSNFYTITLSADYSRVTSVGGRILPDNDRDNTLVAIAGDGSEMIFEADRGATSEFYRVKPRPGATPVPAPAIPYDDYPIIEWR
jgi:hypothetical protein